MNLLHQTCLSRCTTKMHGWVPVACGTKNWLKVPTVNCIWKVDIFTTSIPQSPPLTVPALFYPGKRPNLVCQVHCPKARGPIYNISMPDSICRLPFTYLWHHITKFELSWIRRYELSTKSTRKYDIFILRLFLDAVRLVCSKFDKLQGNCNKY